jgi:hypothetical protein
LLLVGGEISASLFETAIGLTRFIRSKAEAKTTQLPRFPVVVKSTIFMALITNVVIITLVLLADRFLISNTLASFWHYFYAFPFLMHTIFYAINHKKVDLVKMKQAIDWHDTMFETQGGKYFIENKTDFFNETLLYKAASKGNIEEVRKYLESGIDPDEKTTQGWTPLMISTANGHLETVLLFIHFGADVNQPNTRGRTALMFASKYGYEDITKALLNAGAEVNVDDIQKCGTPLVAASILGHKRIVEMLLENGANPHVKDREGKTALDYAQENSHGEIARILRHATKKENHYK